jgi:membrane protein
VNALGSIVSKFLRDRGTHLAAMIAYFALLSFVPLLFLALSLVGLAGEPSTSSELIDQLRRAFPATSVDRLIEIVEATQRNATAIGIVGGVGLLWGSLGFFSVLESAFNIVYGLPNRSFIRQKAVVLVFVAATLAVLFAALVVASLGGYLAARAGVAAGVVANLYSILVSTALILAGVWSVYNVLTNAPLRWRDTLPGAILASVLLQASFQVLPVFVHATHELVALQAFGGLVLLLVWLYLMANVLVFGAEVNWWVANRHRLADEPPAGLA